MSALILLAVVFVVAVAAAPLARRQLRREKRRAQARQKVSAHLDRMRQAIDDMAATIGTSLLPAFQSMTVAVGKLGAAFVAASPTEPPAGPAPTDEPTEAQR